jgi:hypothetical protein
VGLALRCEPLEVKISTGNTGSTGIELNPVGLSHAAAQFDPLAALLFRPLRIPVYPVFPVETLHQSRRGITPKRPL